MEKVNSQSDEIIYYNRHLYFPMSKKPQDSDLDGSCKQYFDEKAKVVYEKKKREEEEEEKRKKESCEAFPSNKLSLYNWPYLNRVSRLNNYFRMKRITLSLFQM